MKNDDLHINSTTMDSEKDFMPLYIEYADTAEVSITDEHREYLMARHGTADLKPLPSADPQDPLNWSRGKKAFHMALISLHTFAGTFMAAGLAPAYGAMAEEYGKSVTECSYFTTIQIAFMGSMPMIWVPIMDLYGRRPFLIVTTLAAMACNIGGMYCKTYEQQMATRALCAFFISSGVTLGGAFTGAMCFNFERGRKNGIWTLTNILGTTVGPILMGFVVYRAGVKWVYGVFALLNATMVIGWVFSDETKYNKEYITKKAMLSGIRKCFYVAKTEERSLTWRNFAAPFKHAKNFRIVIVSITAAVSFAYGNIVFSVETPAIFIRLFHLDAQMLALQFIPMVVGTLIGEVIAGHCSDMWLIRQTKKRGVRHPADRLAFTYLGDVLQVVGLLVWGIYLFKAKEGHWNIRPLIGLGIASAGSEILATVYMAYAIDCHPTDGANAALFMMFVRLTFGFISPFYLPHMFERLGFAGSAGLMAGLIVATGTVVGILHLTQIRKPPQILLTRD